MASEMNRIEPIAQPPPPAGEGRRLEDIRPDSTPAAPLVDLPDADPRNPITAEELVNLSRIGDPAWPEPARKAKLDEWRGVAGVAHSLNSSIKNGLPTSKIEENALLYGKNTYPQKKPKWLIELWWEAFTDPVLLMLTGAAIISIILGTAFPAEDEGGSGWIEGVAILVAVFCVCTVTAVNNWQKERKFRALNALSSRTMRVKAVRNGAACAIESAEVVVGDLLDITTGDQIPGDGVFVMGAELQIDEASMTGEPMPVKKTHDHPFMLAGCNAVDGSGRMVVTAVGVNTEWGRTLEKINSKDDDDEDLTPLQLALADMAKMIGFIGLAVAGLVFFLLMLYWLIDIGTLNRFFQWSQLIDILSFVIVAITIVVVAVPEGLPLAVTICLAYSVSKMARDNNLVRNLASCEVMGGATNICSDKTGTLTMNQMTIVTGYLGGVEWLEGSSFDKSSLSAEALALLSEGIAVNSKANLETKNGQRTFVGNPTECAMLFFLERSLQCNYVEIRDRSQQVAQYPFASAKKRMSTVLRINAAGQPKWILHCKGASEMVLARSTHIQLATGRVPLTPELRADIQRRIDGMAANALRTLIIAYRIFDRELAFAEMARDPPDDELTMIALVGIQDPVRPEVPDAVRRCIEAGITVRMVTGDNIDTAKKIAEQCSIYTPNTGGIAMIGPDFAKLTPGELDKILPKLQVLARSSPTDKHTLVKRLRKNNQVVAVTGDGTNDAPALKKAHVGLAMGIAGTEVAKLAADIIILDDNFTSIVKSVMWGRNIFDNIRKFLQFQLTINAVALIVSFIAAASRQGTPLKPIQLLWVNLIMDTLAALALATELPTEKLLKRKPINILQQRIINNSMIKHIVGQGMYQVAILLILLYVGYKPFGIHPLTDHHFAIIFNAFVLCQVFNEINCRTVNDELNVFEGIHRNVIFLGVIFLTVLFQVLIICFGGKAFHVVLLGWKEWITCIVIGALTLPIGLLLRLIPTPEKVNSALYNVDVQANMDAKADKKAAKKAAKADKVK